MCKARRVDSIGRGVLSRFCEPWYRPSGSTSVDQCRRNGNVCDGSNDESPVMDELRLSDESEFNDDAQADELHNAVSWEEPLLAADLELAYLRALEATEAIEREMDAMPHAEAVAVATNAEVARSDADTTSDGTHAEFSSTAATTPSSMDDVSPSALGQQTDVRSAHVQITAAAEPPRVSEKHVVEAALFVGGMSLTAKKLSSLFHTEHEFGFVECLIDELNQQYQQEGRPYSITLGEGGYRMTLLPEFDSVRNKVFGYGPKDVKLSQDALEVLALVAYRQPITKTQMEALGKPNPGPLLRQLLQRELVRIDREHSASESQRKSDPPYATTPRFLSLFGLGSLRDLPIAEDFSFK